MPAYVLVDIEVTDPAAYKTYRKIAYPVIAEFDGKYLVRGGATEVREGDWKTNRLVVVEFESKRAQKRGTSRPSTVQRSK